MTTKNPITYNTQFHNLLNKSIYKIQKINVQYECNKYYELNYNLNFKITNICISNYIYNIIEIPFNIGSNNLSNIESDKFNYNLDITYYKV